MAEFFALTLSPVYIFTIFIGVTIGISLGILPGLTSTMVIALLLPLTFSMDPQTGIILLISQFVGAIYGGGITAILIGTPGTPAAAATVMDGYPFTKRGEASRAIGIVTLASFGGGIISGILLIFIAPILANIALRFSAPETFALAFFGLSVVSSISGKSLLKGLLSACFGLIVAFVGIDNITGFTRFNFGTTFLMGGFAFIPVMVGLFAMSQVLILIEEHNKKHSITQKIASVLPTKEDLKIIWKTILRGGLTGTFIGAVPGVGGDISAFISYDIERRSSKRKEQFGTGLPEAIAATESSNSGTTGGTLIPLLTLGIPGDSNTAVMLGAFMVHNLIPGPMLFAHHAAVVNTLFAGFIISNIFMLILGFSAIRLFVKIVEIPTKYIVPVVIVLCVVGSFAINNNFLDVIVMFGAGVIGYIFIKGGFPIPPIVLALILGPMAEGNLRRSLVMSQGSPMIFFERPIAAAFIIVAIISLLFPIIKQAIKSVREK